MPPPLKDLIPKVWVLSLSSSTYSTRKAFPLPNPLHPGRMKNCFSLVARLFLSLRRLFVEVFQSAFLNSAISVLLNHMDLQGPGFCTWQSQLHSPHFLNLFPILHPRVPLLLISSIFLVTFLSPFPPFFFLFFFQKISSGSGWLTLFFYLWEGGWPLVGGVALISPSGRTRGRQYGFLNSGADPVDTPPSPLSTTPEPTHRIVGTTSCSAFGPPFAACRVANGGNPSLLPQNFYLYVFGLHPLLFLLVFDAG